MDVAHGPDGLPAISMVLANYDLDESADLPRSPDISQAYCLTCAGGSLLYKT
jgi:hypothetical protein